MHYGNDTVWLVNSKNQLNYRPPQHTKITDNNVCTDRWAQSIARNWYLWQSITHWSVRAAFTVEPFFFLKQPTPISLICLLIQESLMQQQGFPQIHAFQGSLPGRSLQWKHVFFRNSSHRKPSLPGTFTHSKALTILQTRAMSRVISKSKSGLPRASSYTWISKTLIIIARI